MPLIKDGRFTADDWVRAGGDEPPPDGVKLIVPLARLLAEAEALPARAGPLGVDIPNNADLRKIEPHLSRLSLIAIAFPGFADGRGLSLAKRIRRLGYEGELRAAGHLIPDQYAFAKSCGFDTIEISAALAERQPEAHWRTAAQSISLSYQSGYKGPQNILAARRSSRPTGGA